MIIHSLVSISSCVFLFSCVSSCHRRLTAPVLALVEPRSILCLFSTRLVSRPPTLLRAHQTSCRILSCTTKPTSQSLSYYSNIARRIKDGGLVEVSVEACPNKSVDAPEKVGQVGWRRFRLLRLHTSQAECQTRRERRIGPSVNGRCSRRVWVHLNQLMSLNLWHVMMRTEEWILNMDREEGHVKTQTDRLEAKTEYGGQPERSRGEYQIYAGNVKERKKTWLLV
jgi:hypothetical protein